MGREIEVKIRVGDAAAAAAAVEGLGARPVRARHFEDNRLFDRGRGELARSGRLLRIRVADGRGVLTVKTPDPDAERGPYKVRRELETGIGDPDALAAALSALGYENAWRYQKYRREWRLDDVRIFLDEIPWGTFLEIEGDPAGIDAAARRLGYEPDRFERSTYRELHVRHCREAGRPVGDMLFEEERP